MLIIYNLKIKITQETEELQKQSETKHYKLHQIDALNRPITGRLCYLKRTAYELVATEIQDR